MGWLRGWKYRKNHIISGTTAGIQSNYQMKIVTKYNGTINAGETVSLNSHCRADFGDIRFTSYNGVKELDYWLEEKQNSNIATFWVEINSIPITESTIYIYYGKDKITTSNAENTFLSFDHFLGTSLNVNKWVPHTSDKLAASISVQDSTLTIYGAGGHSRSGILSLNQFTIPAIIEIQTLTNGNQNILCWFKDDKNMVDTGLATGPREENKVAMFKRVGGGYTNLISKQVFGSNPPFIGGNVKINDTYKMFKDYQQINGDQRVSDFIDNYKVYLYPFSKRITKIDWIRIRKYVEPEPTHGSWGIEEIGKIKRTHSLDFERTQHILEMKGKRKERM